jgi:ABC-type transport system substrate-binding protein
VKTINSSEDQLNTFVKKEKKKNIFFRFFRIFKKKKINLEIDETLNDLDNKLVYSLSPKKIPNFKQLKYTKKVLSPIEKLLFNIFIILIVVILIFLGIKFLKKHINAYPKVGGEYIEGMVGSPKNINPLYDSARDVDSDISRLIYSSLFKRDKNGSIINDLVENYSVSDNGLEYTVKIKENIKWHNGEQLTAADVVFTFEAIKNPDYGSNLRSVFSGVNILAIDDYSFKFVLTETYPEFIELLTFGILPQNLWGDVSSANAFLNELNIKPIGSGPYKFKSLTKNKSGDIKEFTLVANTDYYNQSPYISKLILKFYSNYNELVSALNNNEVDGLSYLPHSLKSDLVSQNSLNFNSLNLPQITSIFLNSKKNSILSDIKIRQALTEFIDRNKICDEIFSGNAKTAYGPILPSSVSYNDSITKYEYNYEEASTILNEAGWNIVELKADEVSLIKEVINLEKQKKEAEAVVATTTTDTIVAENLNTQNTVADINAGLVTKNETLKAISNWEIKRNIVETFALDDEELIGNWRYKTTKDSGKPYNYLTINLTTVDLIDNISVAEFIKTSWESAGIKTFIKTISSNQVQSEIIKQKNFEALLLSQVVGSDQDVYSFWHSSQISGTGLNISEYKNKEVDKILEEARTSLKSDERIEKYKKFQELLSADSPVIFLYFPTYNYIQNKKVKGFDFINILNPADRFNNISYWYIKVDRKIEF